MAKIVLNLKRLRKIKLQDAIIRITAIVNDTLLITNDIGLKNIEKLKIKIVGI